MSKHFSILVLAISLFGISSCKKDQCLTGDKYKIGSIREVEPFTGIDVNLSAVVEMVRDTGANVPFVEFVVEGNLEEYISTVVSQNTLNISLSDCFTEHENILIIIHYDTLNSISISGPGDVQSSAKLVQDSLNLIINSTGNIYLTADIQKINSQIDGTGNIFINGQVGLHNIQNNNSGSVNTYQAMTQDVVLKSEGSGNTYVRVKNSITGSLSNSGDLFYKGFPSIGVLELSTGEVIDDN